MMCGAQVKTKRPKSVASVRFPIQPPTRNPIWVKNTSDQAIQHVPGFKNRKNKTCTLLLQQKPLKFSKLISLHFLKEFVERIWQKVDAFVPLVIITIILTTFILTMCWENWCWSLLELKGLKKLHSKVSKRYRISLLFLTFKKFSWNLHLLTHYRD